MHNLTAMAGAVLVLAATAGAADAHHSPNAVFKMDARATTAGVMKDVKWTNPHVYFEVVDAKGVTWEFESHGVAYFTRNGVRKADFGKWIGKKVTVESQPALNGAPMGFTRIMTFEDGTQFKMFNN